MNVKTIQGTTAAQLPTTNGTAPHQTLSATRREEIRAFLQQYARVQLFDWKPFQLPSGVSFHRAELVSAQRGGGHSFTAYIPVGPARPGAKLQDPNEATTFFVGKSGGPSQISVVAGPFTLPTTRS